MAVPEHAVNGLDNRNPYLNRHVDCKIVAPVPVGELAEHPSPLIDDDSLEIESLTLSPLAPALGHGVDRAGQGKLRAVAESQCGCSLHRGAGVRSVGGLYDQDALEPLHV